MLFYTFPEVIIISDSSIFQLFLLFLKFLFVFACNNWIEVYIHYKNNNKLLIKYNNSKLKFRFFYIKNKTKPSLFQYLPRSVPIKWNDECPKPHTKQYKRSLYLRAIGPIPTEKKFSNKKFNNEGLSIIKQINKFKHQTEKINYIKF